VPVVERGWGRPRLCQDPARGVGARALQPLEPSSAIRRLLRPVASAGAKAYATLLRSPARSQRQSAPCAPDAAAGAAARVEGCAVRVGAGLPRFKEACGHTPVRGLGAASAPGAREEAPGTDAPPRVDGGGPAAAHPAVPARLGSAGYEKIRAVAGEAPARRASAVGARSVAQVRAEFEGQGSKPASVTATLCTPRPEEILDWIE